MEIALNIAIIATIILLGSTLLFGVACMLVAINDAYNKKVKYWSWVFNQASSFFSVVSVFWAIACGVAFLTFVGHLIWFMVKGGPA